MMKISRRGAILSAMTAVLLLALAACWNLLPEEDGATLIRLENTSAVELTGVTFSSGPHALTFDRIAPGAATEYVEVEMSYRYGFLRATANGRERVIQPVDYVGEEEIGPGRFTFRIALTESAVSTTLRRDD